MASAHHFALSDDCRSQQTLPGESQIVLDVQMLETVLAAEILGHYRSYQILATIGATTDGVDPLARALKEAMQQELERIFRLLNLLHPRLDLHSAYVGLQSTNVAVHDNALEFLDNVLKSQLLRHVSALLDSKITVAERAQIAQRLVRTKIESQEQAVAELVASDDPWLKSCGAYAIGALGIKSLEGQLDGCLNEIRPAAARNGARGETPPGSPRREALTLRGLSKSLTPPMRA